MSDTTYIGQKTRKFNSSAEFDGFSRVVITVTDELEYVAGKNTGRTLTLVCPWGTQEMADSILADIKGYRYHPYAADGAYLDPAAEIGDGVTVNGIYSGIYTMDSVFGRNFLVDISAPADEEIDHEYPYISQQERTIKRKFAKVESEFKVQANEISAKVSKTGGDSKSFGWELDEESWTLKSQSQAVLTATEKGVEITGKIFAKEGGKIGGFDIMSDYLSYNGQIWEGENTYGAYLGIKGFQMGKDFRVDMSGNLYAASGEFSGTVKADKILYGEKNGGFLSGQALALNTVPKDVMVDGVQKSLGYADFANDVFTERVAAEMIRCKGFRYDTDKTRFYLKPITITYATPNGGTSSVTVLGSR